MQGKRLLVVFLSVCMLLVLVPAFTLTGSAAGAVTLPVKPALSTNYAPLSAGETYQREGYLPTVDEGEGTITLTGVGNTNTGGILFPLDGLTAEDDFVVSWTLAGQQHWHTETWGITAYLDSAAGISSGPAYQIYGTGLQYNGVAISSAQKQGTYPYAMYVKRESNGTSTLYLFENGTLIHTQTNAAVANDPVLAFNAPTGQNGLEFTISDLYVYKPLSVPDVSGKLNRAHPGQFTLTNGAEVMDVSETEQCIRFTSNGNFGYNTGDVSADLSALNGKSYVEGFKASIYRSDNRVRVEWTIGRIGGTNLVIMLGSAATGGCYYSGPSGSNQAINYTLVQYATATFEVYVQLVGGNTAVHVFVNGDLVSSFGETGTAAPNFRVRYNNEYGSYFMQMYTTYASSADPELPGMPLGAVNYAIDAVGTLGGQARSPYNAAYGSWNFAGNANGGATCKLATKNLTDLSANDEYVISYLVYIPTGYGGGLELEFGTDGANSQKIYTTPNSGTSLYTKADGTTVAIADPVGTYSMAIHLKPNEAGTARDIYVYCNGALIVSDLNAAILPIAFNFTERVTNWSVSGYSYFYGLRIYKVDPSIDDESGFEPAAAATVVQTAGLTSKYRHIADQGAEPNVITFANMTLSNATYDSGAQTIRFTNNNNNGGTATAPSLSVLNGKSYVIRWTQTWGTTTDTRGNMKVQFATKGSKTLDFVVASGSNGNYLMGYYDGSARRYVDPMGLQQRDFAIRVQRVSGDTTVYIELYVDGALYLQYEEDISTNDIVPMLKVTHSNSSGSMYITMSNFGIYDCGDGYTVSVGSAVGGSVTGIDTAYYNYGDTVTLNAVANEGYSFQYLMVGGRAYTKQPVTLPVLDDMIVEARFNHDDSGSYVVSFFSSDGRLVATVPADEIDENDLPEVPARFGYTSNGWGYVWEDGIYSDINVYPAYIKDVATTYSIAVSGGTADRNAAPFETMITVTASNPASFVCWKDSSGNAVSIDPVYTFFATENISLTAYTAGAAPSYIVRINSETKNTLTDASHFRASFIGETHVDFDYTLVSRGIVYKTGNSDNLTIGAAGVKQKTSSTVGDNQFMYTLNNCPVNTNIYAKAYMQIRDRAGVVTTVYSPSVCHTYVTP